PRPAPALDRPCRHPLRPRAGGPCRLRLYPPCRQETRRPYRRHDRSDAADCRNRVSCRACPHRLKCRYVFHDLALHPRLFNRRQDRLLLRLRTHPRRDRRLDGLQRCQTAAVDGQSPRPPRNRGTQAEARDEASASGAGEHAAMNGLTFVLLVLGGGLALLLFNHDSGQTFGMANEDFGQMIFLLPLAGLLAAGLLAGRRGDMVQLPRYTAMRRVIILGPVMALLYRNDFREVGARLSAGLMPGSAVVTTASVGAREVIIHRSMGGHFQTQVDVDGQPVSMLVDTGASAVVLSYEDAERIGLN